MILILSPARQLRATEEFARQTGRACASCHLDPGGGGELTQKGKAFSASHTGTAEQPVASTVPKLFRLLVGYLHFITAIFWFGTILYVHLVLKPAYAASGLPRGEMKVGIISMAVMGVTGTILTLYRITSLDTLLHSHFGILLLAKIVLYLIMVTSAIYVITVIGPRLKGARKPATAPVVPGDLSLEALASCDGKDGRPACFAFEGKIYDASQSKLWKQGLHMGRHTAGADLTAALQQAPHGSDKMTAIKEVGVLIAAAPRKKELHERVFYFMAYMNLIIVFAVVLILSLWRWG